MKAVTAHALHRFAEAVVLVETSRCFRDQLHNAEACQEAEADRICQDSLQNLKLSQKRLQDALQKEEYA